MAKAKPISLKPMKLDDILRVMLGIKPSSKKPVRKKRSKSKSASKA